MPADPRPASVTEAAAPATRVTARLLVALLLVAVSIGALGWLATLVQDEELNALDTLASPLVHRLASPTLDAVMTGFSLLGSGPFLLALVGAAILACAWRRRFATAALAATITVGVFLLNTALKDLVNRARPSLPWSAALPDPSFPSGHTMDSMAIYGVLVVVAWRLGGPRIGRLAAAVGAALVVAIGVSRVYLGAHYATDVVGGVLAGGLWLLAAVAAFDGLDRDRRRAPAAAERAEPAAAARGRPAAAERGRPARAPDRPAAPVPPPEGRSTRG